MVTLDVQGAFDSVLRRRLIQRMLEQGWARNLVQFVDSFMEDRQAQVQFEDATTEIQGSSADYHKDLQHPQSSSYCI